MLTLNLILLALIVSVAVLLVRAWNNLRLKERAYSEKIELSNAEKHALKIENQKIQRSCASSELLARLVLQSPNAIMLMEKDGTILSINEGFTNMYEYTYEEFTRALGSNYRQTSFSPDVQHRLDTVEATKLPYRYEALNITKSGRQLWTQTALMPVLNAAGEITHLVTIDTDIHHRVTQSDQLILEMERLNEKIDSLGKQNEKLNADFSSLFTAINELYQLIEQTDKILRFVKSISNETRILGLNASIEAARAGEHGKGFQVITNTIIDISDKTIHSIAEINTILNSINAKQNELIEKKADSETRMVEYHDLVVQLKTDVAEIEQAIERFKSLT